MNKGQKHSEESKRKISEANTGKKRTEEDRIKMIERSRTPEARQRSSEIRAKLKIPTKDTKPEKMLQQICEDEGIEFIT